MPPVPSSASALSQPDGLFETVVEVLNDSLVWVSLTDRINHDRLRSMGGVSASAERDTGTNSVTLSSLVFDNSDGWWDRVDVTGLSSFYRRRIRVGVRSLGTSMTTYLGTWLISDVNTDHGQDASVTVVGLAAVLADKEADRVRDGESWHTNKPLGWLVRELLCAEHTRREVDRWSSGIVSRCAIPLATPGQKALSAYGRPPEWDGTRWRNETNNQMAMCAIDNPGIGGYGNLLIGVGPRLWKWDTVRDVYTLLGTIPEPDAKMEIRHIFLNRKAGHGIAVVVAWEPDVIAETDGKLPNMSGAKGGNVQFFWAEPDVPMPTGFLAKYGSGPANVYTGHFSVRAGGHAFYAGGGRWWNSIGRPMIDDNLNHPGYGSNIPLPFGTWVGRRRLNRERNWGAAPASSSEGFVPGGVGQEDFNAGPYYMTRGSKYYAVTYASHVSGAGPPYDSDQWPLHFRFSIGQHAGAFAMQNTGDLLTFVTIRWDAASETYKFKVIQLDTWLESFAILGDLPGMPVFSMQPTFLKYRPDDSALCFGGVGWAETLWVSQFVGPDNCMVGGIMELHPTTFAIINNMMAGSSVLKGQPIYGWLPMDFCYTAPGSTMEGTAYQYGYATFLDSAGIGTGRQWVVAPFDRALPGSQRWTPGPSVMAKYSAGRPTGLLYVPGHGRVYWHEAGSNTLMSGHYIASAANGYPRVEDGGFPPVDSDPSLACGLTYSPTMDALYGISGPGEGSQSSPETMSPSPLTGKYYLWQYASSLTDRVEIADFSGMKVLDALESLAVMGDFVQGYDEGGSYKFGLRPKPTTTTFTLRRDAVLPDETPLRSLKKDRGYGAIYNVAEVAPSAAVLKEPTGHVRLIARPSSDTQPTGSTSAQLEPWNGTVQATATTPRRGTITLKCVEGSRPGALGDGAIAKRMDSASAVVDYVTDPATQVQHRLRFSFLRVSAVVESQLLVAVTLTDETIVLPLEHVKDVIPPPVDDAAAWATGDTIRIGDELEFNVRYRTDNPAQATSSIRLTAPIGKAFPVGTRVAIRARGNNRWSDGPLGIASVNGIVAQITNTQTRVDNENLNTIVPGQAAAALVHDAARGKVHVAWASAGVLAGNHARKVLFASIDTTTRQASTPIVVEAAQTTNDLEDAIGMVLLSDGTILVGYGGYGVRVKESADGGATWPTSTTLDGAWGASTRAFCGFITNAARTLCQAVTQERGGGATLNNLYLRKRTGAGAWDTIRLIYDAVAAGKVMQPVGDGGRIGYIKDANTAMIVGDFTNVASIYDQVRSLYTTNGWTSAATAIAADYTGVGTELRRPICVEGTLGRVHALWVSGGDPTLGYTDTAGAGWTLTGTPPAMAGLPWSVRDRMLAVDAAGSLVLGAFDGVDPENLMHHVWRGANASTGWSDLPLARLAALGDSAGVGDGLAVGTTLYRVYSRIDDVSGASRLEVIVALNALQTGTSFTGTPGVLGKVSFNNTVEMKPGMVLRVANASGIEDMRVAYLDPDKPTTDAWVWRGVGGTVIPLSTGDIVKAYIAPIQNAAWPKGTTWQLGASSVALTFTVPEGVEYPFMVGDLIEVVAPGLVLESREFAKQVAQDTASIAKFGKLPWPGIRNAKFLGYRAAAEVGRRAVADYAWPHFLFEASAPFAMVPVLNTAGLVIDARLLQSQVLSSPNGDVPPIAPDTLQGVAAVVRAYQVNPSDDSMTLTMRAIQPHDY